MEKRLLGTGLGIALAYAAGLAAHAWYAGAGSTSVTVEQRTLVSSGPSRAGVNSSDELTKPTLKQQQEQKPSLPAKSLVLPSSLIEVLLRRGGLEPMLEAMKLSPEAKQRVKQIQQERVEALKQLEVRHARAMKDAEGSYVEIATFPEARQQWLQEMEENLHQVVNDDRAVLLSRLIVADSNDTSAGVCRRELRVLIPENPDGRIQLETRTFNAQSQHIKSHYEAIDDQSKSRWGQLLDFDGKGQ